MRSIFIATITILAFSIPLTAEPPNVTGDVEDGGAPMGDKFLNKGGSWLAARTIGDMQYYKGRIYLGTGDATKHNTGPAPVYFYDLSKNKFGHNYRVHEEKIHKFRVFQDALWIPGTDTTTNVKTKGSSIYRLNTSGWKEIPVDLTFKIEDSTYNGANHLFDVLSFKDHLFVTAQRKGGEVLYTKDQGKTWNTAGEWLVNPRTFSLFKCGGQLFMSGYKGQIHIFNGKTFKKTPYHVSGNAQPLKNTESWVKWSWASNPVNLNSNTVLYLRVGRASLKKRDGKIADIFDLFIARMQNNGKLKIGRIKLPGKPSDITVRDETAYVLCTKRIDSKKTNEKKYEISVFRSKNGINYEPLFYFHNSTKAYSFEVVNGTVYFGLGCGYDNPDPAAGHMLRVPKSSYK